MVPLAIGSQTGGSTILPAAYCGIFGYKASLTGIDRGNIRQLRPTLDTIGLLARSIPDIACLHGVLTGIAGAIAKADIRQLRIGVCHTNNWQHALPETVDALEAAAKSLTAAGASVRQAELPAAFDGIEETFGVISAVEASRALAQEAREHATKLNFWIRDALAAAARHDQSRFDQAQRHVIECQRGLAAMFEQCDVLLTPSTNGEGAGRSRRGLKLGVQPDLDIDARPLRDHPGLPRPERHAGRRAGDRADRQRRAHDGCCAGDRRRPDVTAYSAATRRPSAALTAGITFSAINSIERRPSATSVQSLPQ